MPMSIGYIVIIALLIFVAMICIGKILDYFKDTQAETCYRRRRNYRLRLKIKQYHKMKHRK